MLSITSSLYLMRLFNFQYNYNFLLYAYKSNKVVHYQETM